MDHFLKYGVVSAVVGSALAPTPRNVLFLGTDVVAYQLAVKIADLRGANLRDLILPEDQRPGDIAAVLTNVEPGDFLFVANIQDMSEEIFQIFLQAVYDHTIRIYIDDSGDARSVKLEVQPFTIIANSAQLNGRIVALENALDHVVDARFISGEDEAYDLAESGMLGALLEENAYQVKDELNATMNTLGVVAQAVVNRDCASLASIAVDAALARIGIAKRMGVFDDKEEGLHALINAVENHRHEFAYAASLDR